MESESEVLIPADFEALAGDFGDFVAVFGRVRRNARLTQRSLAHFLASA